MPVPEHRELMHQLRTECCLTQEQVAAHIGISRFTVTRIEKGHSGSIGTRHLLATFYGAPVRELFPELFQATPC